MTTNLRILIGAFGIGVTVQCADAAVIYRCKTYSGGSYWSEHACSKSNGVMVDMVQVPAGMPFKEQTKIADQIYKEKEQAQSAAEQDRKRSQECSAIDRELAEIWSNYKDGKYVPVDKIDAHQARTRELKSLKTKLKCQSK